MSLGLNISGNDSDIVPHFRFDARAGRLFFADFVIVVDRRLYT